MLRFVLLTFVLRLAMAATADVEYSGSGSGVGTDDEDEGGSGSGMATHDKDEDYITFGTVRPVLSPTELVFEEDEDYSERKQGFGMARPGERRLEYTGSGSGMVTDDEDEDYSDNSGSGSGMGTDDEDEDYIEMPNYSDSSRPVFSPPELELSGDGSGDYFMEPDLSIDVDIEPIMEAWEPGTSVIATVEQEEIVQKNCGGCTLDLLVNQTNSNGSDTETIAMAEFLLQSQEIQQLKQDLENKDIQISNLKKIAGELEIYLEEVNQENAEALEAKNDIISEISEEELNQEARIEDLESEDSLNNCRQKKGRLEGSLLMEHELKDEYQQELLEKKDQNREMKQSLDDNIALSNINKLLFKVEQTENDLCELIQNNQVEEMRKMEQIDPQELRLINETRILEDEVERQRSILERQELQISQFEAIEASQLSIMRQHQTKISQLHSHMNDLSKHEPLCLDYDYEYHDYDLDISQSYIEINNSIRASTNNMTEHDLDTQLTHLSHNLQVALHFLDETIPPLGCPHQDSYSEIRNVSDEQATNIGQIAQLLNPLLPQDRQLHLPTRNDLSYGLPQLPEDSLLTVSSVSMSCPPDTQLSTYGSTWDISCPGGECPQQQEDDWPECLQVPECTGSYEFDVEYAHNDIRSCGRNKKPTASACQEFCKSVPGCVGWEWGYAGDNCCAKSKMANRKSGKSGRVAGLINACPPGTSSSGVCMTTPSRPDINGNPSKANTKCIFPFTFNRKTYYSCAPGRVASNMPDDSLWCSTRVDESGKHVSGQGEWGYCSQSCSVERACTEGVENTLLIIGKTGVKPMCDRIERQKHISSSSFSPQNWLIIQRRGQFKNKNQNLFEKNWKEYENGFGDVEGEFWLGLKNMAQITSRGTWMIRVDLVDWDDKEYFAQYARFKVGPAPSYTLHLSGFYSNSTLEDSLTSDEFGSKFPVEGMSFSTKDNDQDKWSTNCAEKYRAGWWFNQCMSACLNGINYDRKLSEWKGITWYGGGKTRGQESDTWKASVMKIKKI